MRHTISVRLLALTVFGISLLTAQPPGGGQGGPPRAPKAAAPIDLTGYWVSIVNEDWKFRMVTPAPGDYNGVPMTAASRKIADTWDPAKDEAAGDACKSYGAPALLRAPGTIHIVWQDDNTLKLDADAGTQTRLFHFGNWKAPAGTPPSLQGDSVANWEGRPGTLRVRTANLKPGYLRKNGVPYGESAELTEYFDLVKESNGDIKFVVTTVVNDPVNLNQPFIVTSNFKKQASEAGFKPSACSAKW